MRKSDAKQRTSAVNLCCAFTKKKKHRKNYLCTKCIVKRRLPENVWCLAVIVNSSNRFKTKPSRKCSPRSWMNLYRSHFWTRVFAVGKQAENWVRRWFKCFYFGPIPNLNCELTQRGLRARWSPRATGCDPWSMWLTCSYPLVERMQKNGQTVCWWENSIGLRLSLHMLSSTPTIKPHHFLHYWKRNFFPCTMWPSFFLLLGVVLHRSTFSSIPLRMTSRTP